MGTASIKSIKMASADDIKKICEIYDWHGKGQPDLFYLGDIMYALGFNITKKICMANGQQEEEEKKFASFDDVVTMVNAASKTMATTMTTLNCANCTTKTKMEP